MSTTAFALSIYPDYTNATEAVLAASLAGASAGSSVIYNTDLGKTRIWNGSAFVDGPTAPGGGLSQAQVQNLMTLGLNI